MEFHISLILIIKTILKNELLIELCTLLNNDTKCFSNVLKSSESQRYKSK